MKLNVKAVVIAEAVVGAALFILCRLAFVVAPDATLAALKYLTHIDWSSVTMPGRTKRRRYSLRFGPYRGTGFSLFRRRQEVRVRGWSLSACRL
jgi:hypothetical protein